MVENINVEEGILEAYPAAGGSWKETQGLKMREPHMGKDSQRGR